MSQKPLGNVVMAVVVGAVVMPLTVRAEAAGQSTRATTQTSGTVQGSIIAVNLDKRRLQVREQDGRIVTVPIDPAAKIMREGRASTLNDLSIGQQITVQQADRNGQSMATSIEVMPGSPTAASGAAASGAAQTPNRGLQSVPNASTPSPSSASGAGSLAAPSSSPASAGTTPSPASPSTSTGMGSSTAAPRAGSSSGSEAPASSSGSSMSGAGTTGGSAPSSANPR